MGLKSFAEVARDLWKGLAGQEDFGAMLAKCRPELEVKAQPHGVPVKPLTGQWPKTGDKMVVIQDDEAIVPKTVVDRLNEVAEESDWWDERGLWVEGQRGIPNAKATREYIEQLEAEALELRAKRDLGDLEELT